MNDHTSPPEQPAAWLDGDPLMEAIAAAVWERCGRHAGGGSGLVVDDPRNIAAVAVSAVRPPATDRTALLLWAADQIDAETRQAKAHGVLEPDKFRPCRDASAQLRRMAAGCPQCGDAGACNGGPCPLAAEPAAAGPDQTDTTFVPPAARNLPAGTLEAAEIGANRLDAWARTPNGRNFLAHALVQLARTGWLRAEPGDGWEPMADADAPAAGPQQPKTIRCDIAVMHRPHPAHDWTQRPDGPVRRCPGVAQAEEAGA